jgi:hypothetical protein
MDGNNLSGKVSAAMTISINTTSEIEQRLDLPQKTDQLRTYILHVPILHKRVHGAISTEVAIDPWKRQERVESVVYSGLAMQGPKQVSDILPVLTRG